MKAEAAVAAMVVNTVGQAQAHHGRLFANARATRVKLLVHDGFGVWCATLRLHSGSFPFFYVACKSTPLTPAGTGPIVQRTSNSRH